MEGDFLKIARVKRHKQGLQLLRLDKIPLVEPIHSHKELKNRAAASGDNISETEDADSIFGLNDIYQDTDPASSEGPGDIELGSFEENLFTKDSSDSDLVQEASHSGSNEELLVEYLDDCRNSSIKLALNIEAGNTTYQIINGQNFNNLKNKEIQLLVADKLKAIYGHEILDDHYDYVIDKNGKLIIASVDEEPHTLQLVNSAIELYDKKYVIKDVFPDETAMVGLFRNHYKEEEGVVTGLIQLGPDKCRMVFVNGHEILKVSPVINEGTGTKKLLNTIFSKILYLLDTGEIQGVDRFVLFNNTLGEKANDFFTKNFQNLHCEDFNYNPDQLLLTDSQKDISPGYTTAIAIAAAAANAEKENYPTLSFLPQYIAEKQKMFKLQWHGLVLLLLIGLTPVVLNHFYQQNLNEINQLDAQENQIQLMISDLQPLVTESEQLTSQISGLQDQLSLLTELSRDNIRWSITLDRFNMAVEENEGIWITALRQNQDVLMVEGYSLTRVGIPNLANQFPEITLMSVRKLEMRDRDIYNFNLMIHRAVEDENLFTPEQASEIELLLTTIN
ncbi:MAG: hypothetical protein EA390_01055 [Balneolaceae bacterium]|nr:MAG: hypothetical protein EA390_01055 [Balneolaceae bacterium]